MKHHIPNALTLSRYAAVPLLLVAWYLPGFWGAWGPLLIVLLACISDFLDGFLARRWQVQSELGRLLDPNADKLIVAAALILLCADGLASPVAVALILGRELLISGLREHLATKHVTVHVSQLAKWKTTTQMLAVLVLLVGHGVGFTPMAAFMLLWLAVGLTLWTGAEYFIKSLKHIS